MTVTPNPIASGHLPFFITPPGETDVLLHVTGWFVLLCVVGLGVLFFTIHSLPERVAHRTKKVQFDIVAVLCLLALLTHNNFLWVAALLLAFIDLPDFLSPVMRIATAVENIAGQKPPESPEVASASTLEVATPAATEAERSPSEPAPKKTGFAETSHKKGAGHA